MLKICLMNESVKLPEFVDDTTAQIFEKEFIKSDPLPMSKCDKTGVQLIFLDTDASFVIKTNTESYFEPRGNYEI